ncbi:hypothetical protein BVIET440_130148 [Burkholderia vietnamiensis]
MRSSCCGSTAARRGLRRSRLFEGGWPAGAHGARRLRAGRARGMYEARTGHTAHAGSMHGYPGGAHEVCIRHA